MKDDEREGWLEVDPVVDGQLIVNMTDEQLEMCERIAKEAGVTVEDVLRETIRNKFYKITDEQARGQGLSPEEYRRQMQEEIAAEKTADDAILRDLEEEF